MRIHGRATTTWTEAPRIILILAVVALDLAPAVMADAVPFFKPSFSFSYNTAEDGTLIPITSQCETVKLKWGRGQAEGPAPIAPYTIQVFSSSLSTPLVVQAGQGPTFDWQVPFPPRTQYQICMWDSKGNSGGCQAIHTVVQATGSGTPSCEPPGPSSTLAVTVGPLSPPGMFSKRIPLVKQCSDLVIQPTTGSPPFTLTVAPSSHPPVRLTSTTMKPINWTLSLPEGFPFFLGLESSDGLLWSNGPLFARTGGPTECLAPGTISSTALAASAAGASAGGLLIGALVGGIATIWWLRKRGALSNNRSPRSSYPLPSKSKPESNNVDMEFGGTQPARSIASSAGTTPYRSSPVPSRRGTPPTPAPEAMSYPPPLATTYTPPVTPDRSHFSIPPRSLARSEAETNRESVIDPFDVSASSYISSPTSSHFPLDDKRHLERQRSRAALMREGSISTFASTSRQTMSSAAYSSSPLLGGSHSSRGSLSRMSSRLTRAPTYSRHAPVPRSHLSVSELLTDDRSLIAGNTVDDLPPTYMMEPTEEEISVAGGRLS